MGVEGYRVRVGVYRIIYRVNEDAGTVEYFCSLHPDMKALIETLLAEPCWRCLLLRSWALSSSIC